MEVAVEAPFDAPLQLRAVDRARNIDRRYEVQVIVDLFGRWHVVTAWGRAGTAGQTRHEVHDDRAAAERAVRAHLRRRATAPRWTGVAYTVVAPQCVDAGDGNP